MANRETEPQNKTLERKIQLKEPKTDSGYYYLWFISSYYSSHYVLRRQNKVEEMSGYFFQFD